MRVCSFESRRKSEMQSLIERHGGTATVAPSMQEIRREENREALQFAEALFAGRVDVVIFFTGVGARALLDSIETAYDRSRILAALDRCTIIVRGPKPTAVLREWQVHIDHRAPEPNTWRELLSLIDAGVPVKDRMVAVQEYGQKNEPFYEALQQRGARLMPVPVYVWALPDDTGPLELAIRSTIAGEFDVLMFTSAHQLANVLEVAARESLRDQWIDASRQCVIASIGPTTSDALQSSGLPVDVEASPPKMGQLVRMALETAPQILQRKRSPNP